MPMNTLTNSIEKPGTFSSGALRQNYIPSWNQNPSKDKQEDGLSILLDANVPTNTKSSSENLDELKNSLKHHSKSLSIDNYALLNLLGKTLSASPHSLVQNLLDESILTYTSTAPIWRFVGLNDFPAQIREFLEQLQNTQTKEDDLYEIAEAIVEWLIENPEEYQTSLSVELRKMSAIASRILIVSLRNTEAQINNKYLLDAIGYFLRSPDKVLAQSSATCLLVCGGSLGDNIVQKTLLGQDLPHYQLIQGVIKLLLN